MYLGFDRFGYAVVGKDVIYVIGRGTGRGFYFHHNIKTNALRHAALGLKRADFDVDHMISYADTVQRDMLRRGDGARLGMGKSVFDFRVHGRTIVAQISNANSSLRPTRLEPD